MNWTHEKPKVPGWYWYRTMPGDNGDWAHQDETIICVEQWAGRLGAWMVSSDVTYELSDARGLFWGPIERPRGYLPNNDSAGK